MGPAERAAHIGQFLKVPGSMLFQMPLEKEDPVLKTSHKFARGLVMGMCLFAEEHIAFFRRRPRRLVYHRVDN